MVPKAMPRTRTKAAPRISAVSETRNSLKIGFRERHGHPLNRAEQRRDQHRADDHGRRILEEPEPGDQRRRGVHQQIWRGRIPQRPRPRGASARAARELGLDPGSIPWETPFKMNYYQPGYGGLVDTDSPAEG